MSKVKSKIIFILSRLDEHHLTDTLASLFEHAFLAHALETSHCVETFVLTAAVSQTRAFIHVPDAIAFLYVKQIILKYS